MIDPLCVGNNMTCWICQWDYVISILCVKVFDALLPIIHSDGRFMI